MPDRQLYYLPQTAHFRLPSNFSYVGRYERTETANINPGRSPIIVSIVVVPMMVSVPPLPLVPPIFVRMWIVAVSVITIVIGPELLVSGANVNAKAIVCFGFGGRRANNPSPANPNRKYLFIKLFSRLDGLESLLVLLLGLDQAAP